MSTTFQNNQSGISVHLFPSRAHLAAEVPPHACKPETQVSYKPAQQCPWGACASPWHVQKGQGNGLAVRGAALRLEGAPKKPARAHIGGFCCIPTDPTRAQAKTPQLWPPKHTQSRACQRCFLSGLYSAVNHPHPWESHWKKRLGVVWEYNTYSSAFWIAYSTKWEQQPKQGKSCN